MDAPSRHEEQHSCVLLLLVLLESVDCELPVVDSDEVLEFFVLFDIDVGLLDPGLQAQDVLLLALLALPEALQCCLAER